MEARDHGVLIFPTKKICGLEWMIWALEAARQYNETRELGTHSDMPTYYCSDSLSRL